MQTGLVVTLGGEGLLNRGCDVHDSTAAGTGDGLCAAISGAARNPSEVMDVWPWVRVFFLQGEATEVLPELELVS